MTVHRERPVLPDNNVTLVKCSSREEAHFICAILNSTLVDFAARSFYSAGGGGIARPAVLKYIRIPKFYPASKVHQELAGLSQNAHYAVSIGDEVGLKEIIDPGIDELAAQVWRLNKAELKEIEESLEELKWPLNSKKKQR